MASKSAVLHPHRKNSVRAPRPGSKSSISFPAEDAATKKATPVNGNRHHTLLKVAEIAPDRASKQADHTMYLQALTENNPLAIVILDENRRIQMCNPAFELLFGYHQTAIYGTDLDTLLAPDTLVSEARDLSRRASTGEVIRVKTKRRRRDGSLVEVQILGVPLVVNGKRIGCFGMYEDITERRQAEQAQRDAEQKLRENEAHLRVLIEQLPAVLWTVDNKLRFTSASGSGLARRGIIPSKILGRALSEYFETNDQSFLPIAAHRRAVIGEPVKFQVEWKGVSYASHVEPLRGPDGKIKGAICMSLDITDRKQLEEQLRQSQKMEAVGRLAGGISHDFNNLLMVIQGYADLLVERFPDGDPVRRNAEQIQAATQRATSLTRQLLAFSRKQMLAPKILNIQSVVADMEKILRRVIGEDIVLETSSAEDLGLVKADRSQIEQVILNLAVNARDAMPQGGRITIEAANVELDASFVQQAPAVLSPGRYVMLAVTDNGCGMDSETQAHIFEPFFTTKEKGKGTGLGLATVYGVVKQSGGYIWVSSDPGQGASFKIYLPRIEDEIAESEPLDPLEAALLFRGSETVLLVEDEKGVRELTREYLERCGYKVLEAQDGRTALEIAAKHVGPIQLLITDVVMPGISGREVAERLTRVRPHIKTLYMSGYTDQAVVRHGVIESDVMLLQKPFTGVTLIKKLREILPANPV